MDFSLSNLPIGYIALLIGVIVVIILQLRSKSKPTDTTAQQFLHDDVQNLSNRISELQDKLSATLTENSDKTTKSVQAQLSESQKLIQNITERLKGFEDTNSNVLKATGELEKLQTILLNPKHRGNFGEFQLNAVLDNFFPPNQWQSQYSFKNGEAVDAIIHLKDGLILPIDSKFSIDSYNRMTAETDSALKAELAKEVAKDLKTRINETSKYIRPAENTMDFAFMFIPSEALYYDMLVANIGSQQEDLIEYAYKEKKVIIVSPTTFVAYLQTVLQGLRSLQIDEQAKDIQKYVGQLGLHLNKYEELLSSLGKSLGTTVGHYNNAHKEFSKIDKDVVKIAGGENSVEPLVLDKPQVD